jgi:nucleoside phosphorylase
VIEASIEPRELPAGRDHELEIRLTNAGEGTCTDIVFRVGLPPEILLLRGRNRVEVAELVAGDTWVHKVTVRPRAPGAFNVTSANFSYRNEYGTSVRVPGFQAGLTVGSGAPQPQEPDLGIAVVSGPLARSEWGELRLRVQNRSLSPLRGLGLAIAGPIRVASPGPKARLPDLAQGQDAEVSFMVCPDEAGSHVPARVRVTYSDGSWRPRAHDQAIPLAVSHQPPAEGTREARKRRQSGEHRDRAARPVLVLTALDLEYQAVRAHLTGLRTHRHQAGTLFETGRLPGCAGEITIALTGEGNAGAAVLAERAMSTFGPQALLFAGIAGALKDDIKLGDVVVATKVYAYHGRKEEEGDVLARPRSWDAPHELEQTAHYIARARSWASYLTGSPPGQVPQVHFKPIAAGEVLLASRVAPTAQHLHRTFNDAAAIEMESAGVSQASQFNRSLPTLIIRGISDRADGGKRALDEAGWQSRAADHAAAFALALAAELIAHEAGESRLDGGQA